MAKERQRKVGDNATTQEFIFYDDDYYRCGEEWLERCEFVDNRNCRVYEMEIPQRYKNKVDSCMNLGKNLNNDSREVVLEVKTLNYMSSLDFVKFYIFDKDRRFSIQDGAWIWKSEFEGQNVGLPEDLEYTIEYK